MNLESPARVEPGAHDPERPLLRLSPESAGLAARLVFMTGGALTESTRRFVEAEDHVVLEKPFRDAELFDVVHAAARRV